MINCLSNSYERQHTLHEFAATSLELMDPEALEFNLPQLFQCLRTNTREKVFRLLMRVAKKSRLLCHKILWMAKVEGTADINSKRKVPLPYLHDELPAIVGQLSAAILSKMSAMDAEIYREQTEFFQRITEISGALKVKEQTKAEKKSIIQKYLEKYQKELESRDPMLKSPIYLITNPHLKVTRIQPDSGLPMQSAERCPIMVTFWVSRYEGPDYTPAVQASAMSIRGLLSMKNMRHMSEAIDHCTPAGAPHNEDVDSANKQDRNGSFQVDAERGEMHMRVELVNDSPATANKALSSFARSMAGGPASRASPTSKLPTPGESPPAAKRKEVMRSKRIMFSSNKALRRPPRNPSSTDEKPVSCIFKAKDDVRQDTLSLQVIRLFQDIFKKSKLDLFLYPYSTVSNRTGDVSFCATFLG